LVNEKLGNAHPHGFVGLLLGGIWFSGKETNTALAWHHSSGLAFSNGRQRIGTSLVTAPFHRCRAK
jgi:hypothetical protein